MEIVGLASSPLYKITENRFGTEINDLTIAFEKQGTVSLYYPDGKVRQLDKIENGNPSLVELIYAGRFAALEKTLSQLKQTHPEIQCWRDHSLASLALEVYYDQKDKLGVNKAKAMAREVLQVAIRINPDDHAFSLFSLGFY